MCIINKLPRNILLQFANLFFVMVCISVFLFSSVNAQWKDKSVIKRWKTFGYQDDWRSIYKYMYKCWGLRLWGSLGIPVCDCAEDGDRETVRSEAV